MEGISASDESNAEQINTLVARILDAEVILVGTPVGKSLAQLNAELCLTASFYGGADSDRVIGAILNMVNAPTDRSGLIRIELQHPAERMPLDTASLQQGCPLFSSDTFKLVGAVPWDGEMTASRTADVLQYLGARPIHEGAVARLRVRHVMVAAQSVEHFMLKLEPGLLIFTPHDRQDILAALALAVLNGLELAGVCLTGCQQPAPAILEWFAPVLKTGLPVWYVDLDIYHCVTLLPRFSNRLPVDDPERVELIMNCVAHALDRNWLATRLFAVRTRVLTPAAFRYTILNQARQLGKTIVLPEGEEIRTIRAAAQCASREVARTILLGNCDRIRTIAHTNGIALPPGVELRDPEHFRLNYLEELLARRRHKGLTEERARQALEDSVVVGTLMVALGEVDGLVSGAIHTTANTIRPALQLIKTKPDAKLVSSVFFMCLPDQVLVYGDCAINPDPNAQELADIALQSAESARAFGIEPRVALLSYSTGQSGTGVDVDKVHEAVRIARALQPDLLLDGPLQYDAALIPEVARSKAPDSPVAGRATVLVFPDLNTGNTTYKAVQRSANAISIGPMLQGLNRPVNDLSRGATVEDILYTIAITAIQAGQLAKC
jgi:phosphate acetyltransferase